MLSRRKNKIIKQQIFILARHRANILPELSLNLHNYFLSGITSINLILQLGKQAPSFFISNNPRLLGYCEDQAGRLRARLLEGLP